MSVRVEIEYVNWKGRRSYRVISPGRIFYGCNEYHVDMQWLMEAWDHDKGAMRTFAMKDIHGWTPIE